MPPGLAVFDHHDHGVARFLVRREGDEPGRQARLDVALVLHLGGAGLGADPQAGHGRLGAGAVRVFRVGQHRLVHDLQMVLALTPKSIPHPAARKTCGGCG